jgi:hypothetical protein
MANLTSPFTIDPLSSATGFSSPNFAVDATGNISMNGNLVINSGNITNGSTVLLSPTTLGSGITGSSLTSLGTLNSLTVVNPIVGNVAGYAASLFAQNSTVTIDSANNIGIVSNNAQSWSFRADGSTRFPNYSFPAARGTTGQVLVDDGNGNLSWTTLNTGGGGSVITAGNITGATLNATVLTSSLTTVGTLQSLTVTSLITSNGGISGGSSSHTTGLFSGNVTATSVPTAAGHLTNKQYVDAQAIALSVGLS